MVSSPRAWAGLGARLLILSIVLLVSACVGVPETQLAAYTDMFGQARQAGHLIYKEMIPALEEGKAEKTAEAFSVSLGPEAFERGDCDPAFAAFASQLARCELLGTVARYNDALLALARGASTEESRARLEEIFAGLSTVASIASLPTLFPWAPAVIEPIKAIIGQALELRDRAALKAKLEEGAPYVADTLVELRKDVDRIYKVQRAYYYVRLQNGENRIVERFNPALARAAQRSLPTDPTVVVARQALIAQFDALFNQPEPRLAKRLSEVEAPSADPLSPADVAFIDARLDAVAPEVAAFRSTVNEWRQFTEALRSYDRMLAAVADALDALLRLSKDPFAGGGAVSQLGQAALVIRNQVEAIRRSLAAPRPNIGG